MDAYIIGTTSKAISSGGTINGNLTIAGDLTVSGGGALAFDEILEGTQVIDITNSEAFLVRKNGDGGDVFTVNTSTVGATLLGALTIGSDGSGHDVIFYSDTAGDNFTWDSSAEKLTITGTNGATALDIADGNLVVADSVDIEGDIDVNGTSNLDNTDIDGTLAVDGTTISLDATTSLNIDNSNTSNGITIATATSGVPISIGHATSETTVNDNLVVTGDIDANGSLDVDGTANLDAVDIDGTFTQDAGNVVFNEAGADYDFRIESAGDANAFFVDGAGFRCYMGHNSGITMGGGAARKLAIHNTTADDSGGIQIMQWAGANSTQGSLSFGKSLGTSVGDFTILTTGRPLGRIAWYGDDGVDFVQQVAEIGAVANTVGANDMGGDIVFKTSAGSAAAPSERMRIDEDGNVGVGGTGPILSGTYATSTRLTIYDPTDGQRPILEIAGNSDGDGEVVSAIHFSNNDNADTDLTDGGSKLLGQIICATETDDTNAHNDSGGDILFYTKPLGSVANSAVQFAMAIDSNQNVGIGTASPDYRLEVEDSTAHTRLNINAYNGSTNRQAGLWLKNKDGDWQINNDDSTSDFIIYDNTSSADRLHITQAGNVGIGDTDPSEAKLSITGVLSGDYGISIDNDQNTSALYIDAENTTTRSIDLRADALTTGTGAFLYSASTNTGAYKLAEIKIDVTEATGATALQVQNKSTGSTITALGGVGTGSASGAVIKLQTAETTVVDGDYLGRIEFSAPLEASGTDAILAGAAIWAEADDTFAADNNSTELVFGTNTSAAYTERMRITSGGNVGFGHASPAANVHITSGESNAAPVANGDELFIEGSGHTGLTICSETDASCNIFFGDSGDSDQGAITYDNEGGSNSLAFKTAATLAMTISNAGEITAPLQPAFCVHPSSTQSDIAINSTVEVVWGTERFDQGADFASNTFTAPVTGKYQFNVMVRLNQVDSAAGYYHLNIETSNETYWSIIDPDFGQDAAYWSFDFSVLADMDASDTAKVNFFQSGGTQQTDVDDESWFSGYLVC